jgi:hypothetical protein
MSGYTEASAWNFKYKTCSISLALYSCLANSVSGSEPVKKHCHLYGYSVNVGIHFRLFFSISLFLSKFMASFRPFATESGYSRNKRKLNVQSERMVIWEGSTFLILMSDHFGREPLFSDWSFNPYCTRMSLENKQIDIESLRTENDRITFSCDVNNIFRR